MNRVEIESSTLVTGVLGTGQGYSYALHSLVYASIHKMGANSIWRKICVDWTLGLIRAIAWYAGSEDFFEVYDATACTTSMLHDLG